MKRPRFPWKLWSRKRMATEVGYVEANSEFVVTPEEAQAQDAQDAFRKTMPSCTLEETKAALVKAVSTKRARATPHAPNAASVAVPLTIKCEGSGSK